VLELALSDANVFPPLPVAVSSNDASAGN